MHVYDDFLWDFDVCLPSHRPLRRQGFALRPHNSQPEKKKGKHPEKIGTGVKSGKYAKKKDVAMAEHTQNTSIRKTKNS